MTFDYSGTRIDPYAKEKPAPVITPPSPPPPIDEGMIDTMKRRGGQLWQQHFVPLSEAAGTAARHGTDTATFGIGLPDKLEGLYNAATGKPPPDPELLAAERRRVDAEHPTAAAVGRIGGAAGQAGAASRLLGRAIPALGRPTAPSQAANQGIVGGAQGASQNIAEAIKEGRPVNPSRLALSTIAGTGFGAAGGALASKAAGWTPRGTLARTLPEGLSAAERTAIAQQAQRAAFAGAPDADLATLMRLSGNRQAPVIERAMQRGITQRTGEPLDVVPPQLADRLTQTRGAPLQNLEEIKGAITNRPAAPEPPRPMRGRQLSVGGGLWGGVPALTYRGPSGPPAPGPTAERAARMMQDQPERAAGLLGRVPLLETAGASLTGQAGRAPAEELAAGFLGLRPPEPKKRKP